MLMVLQTNEIASKNSGMLLVILLLIQAILVPGLGWILAKNDAMQNTLNQTQNGQAIFGDRQIRQGQDIADIKNVLKGVESKDDANAAHHQIWQTDQDQYQKIRSLTQQQQKIKSRVQRLETLSEKN